MPQRCKDVSLKYDHGHGTVVFEAFLDFLPWPGADIYRCQGSFLGRLQSSFILTFYSAVDDCLLLFSTEKEH
jgi:hypothetical protein